MAGPANNVPTSGFRNGTPVILPHEFGNVVAGANQPFGNPEPQPNNSLSGGNVIITAPSPAHFGNLVSFCLQVLPPVVNIAPNSTGTTTVYLTNQLGTNTVTLGSSGMPTGITVAFSPSTVAQGAPSTATITVASTVAPGRYDFAIGNGTEEVQVTVNVT